MSDGAEFDRRRFLKRAGTAAWATPFVLTLSASRAGAQAASCLPNGSQCGVTVANSPGICTGGTTPCCGQCVAPPTIFGGIPCACLG